MNVRRTAMLAGVFLILAWYFVSFERGARQSSRPQSNGAGGILRCDRVRPTELRVDAMGREVSAHREGNRWRARVSAPDTRSADLAFDRLADSLCELPVVDRIADVNDLADFGLAPPAAEVRVSLNGSVELLQLGRRSPAANFAYAKFAGQPAVLKIGMLLLDQVERVASHAR